MKLRRASRQLLAALAVVATAAPDRAGAQQTDRPAPAPQGSRLAARDGDTIVIDDDASVRVVRRRRAHLRAVFNATQRSLILLAQYLPQSGTAGSGVDEAYTFRDVEGNWTLGGRWEGDTTIEVYSLAGQPGGSSGFGFRTPQGNVQLLTRDLQQFKDPAAAVALLFRGSGRSSGAGAPFDQVEKVKTEEANGAPQGVSSGVSTGVAGGTTSAVSPPPSRPPAVFPSVGSARKIHDVRPVWPDEARRAGIQGTVILELTIGTEGDVTNARVLRGIPQLDRAAIECVRQWRYEPTLVNGQPVLVTLTAAVTFP